MELMNPMAVEGGMRVHLLHERRCSTISSYDGFPGWISGCGHHLLAGAFIESYTLHYLRLPHTSHIIDLKVH